MEKRKVFFKKLIVCVSVFLLICFISFIYLNAQEQQKSESESPNDSSAKKIKDSVEKHKIYNQIQKDIEKLSLEACIKYIDWNSLVQSDYPDSSIFAIEIILKKWGDKAEDFPYFYNRLGNEYLMKDELVKSDEIYQTAYYVQKHIKKDERKLAVNRRNAELYALGIIFRKNNKNSVKYTYDKTIKFIKENPDLTAEQLKEANRIIDVYKKINMKQIENEKVKELAQTFLNNMASYINKKDAKGFSVFLMENMEDIEMAKVYTNIGIKKFFNLKSISFKVVSLSGGMNIYDVYYEWITDPKNAIPSESNEVTHPEFTFKYDGKKLILVD